MSQNNIVDKLFHKGRTMLAPMAGYTDVAFRSICQQYYCGATVTEMVSSKALVMHNQLTYTLLTRMDNDYPCIVQIFGHEPQVMADSVQLPQMKDFEGIDINMGCPVRKIVGNGDGSALLENITLASQIISAVKKATDKPLSVKFRLGVNDKDKAVDFAKMCQDSGADFVTVHLRTRNQMYSGNADYDILPTITSAVSIPVIANGDIDSKEKADYLIQECGAYGVAIGRGALGKPYIFAEIASKPYQFDVLATIKSHATMLCGHKPPRVVANEMKKHIAYYLKGMRGAKSTIVAVQSCGDVNVQIQMVENFLQGRIDNND